MPARPRSQTDRLFAAARHQSARLRRLADNTLTAPPAPAPRYDSWLQAFWGPTLEQLDARCADGSPPPWEAFAQLDADLWALLLSQEYDVYPHIKATLPDVPDAALQATWNGTSGVALAAQTVAFYTKVVELNARHGARWSLDESRVLDFGCGWGRLTRSFIRDVAPGSLFGCDPVAPILDVCRSNGVPAHLAQSDFVPERLPFDQSFDLIYAFSVFTHLSEQAHRASLRAIHDALVPGGLLVVTVRPPQYLRVSPLLGPALAALGSDPERRLAEPLYLFAPHDGQPLGAETVDGEVTYGETVVTPAYIRQEWTEQYELLDFELLLSDPHQVVVALRPR
jgi:SAM-dependent methyltransferase